MKNGKTAKMEETRKKEFRERQPERQRERETYMGRETEKERMPYVHHERTKDDEVSNEHVTEKQREQAKPKPKERAARENIRQ